MIIVYVYKYERSERLRLFYLIFKDLIGFANPFDYLKCDLYYCLKLANGIPENRNSGILPVCLLNLFYNVAFGEAKVCQRDLST